MIKPIAPGATPPPSSYERQERQMKYGDNALTAPTTPTKRVPVVDKTKVDPAMLEAAKGMEGMFLDYLMQVMRKTVPKNDFDMESPATGIYRSMMDSEVAKKAAEAGGVGLADHIIAYWNPGGYTENRAQNERSTEEDQ